MAWAGNHPKGLDPFGLPITQELPTLYSNQKLLPVLSGLFRLRKLKIQSAHYIPRFQYGGDLRGSVPLSIIKKRIPGLSGNPLTQLLSVYTVPSRGVTYIG